ncbi:MAG: hypothetical protein JSW20_06020 [Nitrospiraceae bacterium]|nr:MAG: hypothetical protein JSW20_06020 [Nitrospiraceae bacterium]
MTDLSNTSEEFSRSGKSGRSGLLILCAVIITILPFLVHEIYSYDIWWQITIGTDILESGRIPVIDMYSAAGRGRAYHDSHWLFQVVTALSHNMMGMVGVQIVMIFLWGAILSVCYRAIRKWTGTTVASLLLFIVAMASVERFLPRPELITFLGIAGFYMLLQENRFRSWKNQALLGLIQVLWANSHGLFIIGIFMVGCYWLFALIEQLRGRTSDFRPLSTLLLVVMVCSFLTPHGIDGWKYSLLLFKEAGEPSPGVFQELGELSPTFGKSARSGIAFWFYLTLLSVSAGSGLTAFCRDRRITPRTLILFGLFLASLTGRRNIILFALVSAPFIAESLSLIIPKDWLPKKTWAVTIACILIACAWFPLSGTFYSFMTYPARTGFGVTPSFFPLDLPAFLKGIHFKGQVLNSSNIGGFYLYHFFPDAVPLIDGRWEVYDQDELEFIRSSSSTGNYWRQLIERYKIKGILLSHGSREAQAMLPSLSGDADWRLVYLDQAASFWMRSGDSGTPPAVDFSRPENIPYSFRVDDAYNLASFLAWTGKSEALAVHLERSLQFGQKREWFLERLGKVRLELMQWESAKESFEKLYQLDRTNTTALNELAFLAYRRGDLSEAVHLIKLALDLEPDNRDFQANYQRLKQAQKEQENLSSED